MAPAQPRAATTTPCSGTARQQACVDLNPSGFNYSYAYGTSGTQQVGYGYGPATGGNGFTHALLWSGTAASYVDLNPSGFDNSYANGISGTQQVGYGHGEAMSGYHAMLWTGLAESYVDLNPSGFDYSCAYGTNGTQQVGSGYGSATDGNNHALLWNGEAKLASICTYSCRVTS